MKKTFFKIACVIAVVIIIAGLTASGGADSRSAPAARTIGTDGPFAKYSTPVTVNVVAATNEALQKNTLKDNLTFEKNPWTEAFERDLNIKLNYKWIATSGDDFSQKMNLSIASGDIPDIIHGNVVQLARLVNADIIADLTGLFDKYASPLFKEWMANSSSDPFLPTLFNKKQMAIPRAWSNKDPANAFIWIRTDWLKNLNMNPPKTMDDLLALSKAFTYNDPDKNGKNDTFGLSVQSAFLSLGGSNHSLEGFFAGYHAYPQIWLEKGGQLVYGGIQPEVGTALKKLNELYKDGQLDREFTVKTGAKANEDITAGRVGIMFANQPAPIGALFDSVLADPNCDWRPFLLVSADSKPVMMRATIGNDGYYSIKKGFSNPEAVVKMMNLYCELYYNQYRTYGITEDVRTIWQLSPVSFVDSAKNVKTHLAIKEAVNTGNTGKLDPEQKAMYDNVNAFLKGERRMWGYYRIFGPGGETETSQGGIKYYTDNNLYFSDKFVAAPTKTMGTAKASLDTLQAESFVKIIIGEETFEKFTENWKKLGGDDITKEVNEWYATVK